MVLTPSSPPAHIRCVGPVCYNALSDKVYYNGSNGKINGPQVKLQTVAVVGVVGAVATIGAVKAHQTLKATRNSSKAEAQERWDSVVNRYSQAEYKPCEVLSPWVYQPLDKLVAVHANPLS
eukprot:CAMPEP_0197849934 /NCGR_PEP_ID=MMETSP1438-20131217/13695_1 /TAXON_ID=1461541 /ORGANISM="Pterosperma sp., Strain CCMP1384" /LENGTH=120 /DNA_ID=CAMNT_0043462841 /DNA_START=224 /DNA_END=587 /DNA_ORIENTATION=-